MKWFILLPDESNRLYSLTECYVYWSFKIEKFKMNGQNYI